MRFGLHLKCLYNCVSNDWLIRQIEKGEGKQWRGKISHLYPKNFYLKISLNFRFPKYCIRKYCLQNFASQKTSNPKIFASQKCVLNFAISRRGGGGGRDWRDTQLFRRIPPSSRIHCRIVLEVSPCNPREIRRWIPNNLFNIPLLISFSCLVYSSFSLFFSLPLTLCNHTRILTKPGNSSETRQRSRGRTLD